MIQISVIYCQEMHFQRITKLINSLLLYNLIVFFIKTFFFNIFKYAKTIDKGDYTIRLYIRHEKFETLERLKSLVLYARHSISNVPQDIYTSYAALIRGSKKSNISEKILKGQQITLFLDSIVDEKLPKGVAPGHFLKGELNLYSDSQINKIVSIC